MKKIAVALVLTLFCVVYIGLKGSTYKMSFLLWGFASRNAEDYSVEIEQEREYIQVVGKEVKENELILTVASVEKGGWAFIDLYLKDEMINGKYVYVHPFGLITEENILGNCTGGNMIPLCLSLFLSYVWLDIWRKYKKGMKKNFFQYKNIMNLGLLFYFGSMLMGTLLAIPGYQGLYSAIENSMAAGGQLSVVVLPVALVVSILICISNLQLMRKEGKNWKNMLGFFLSAAVCLGTMFPWFLGEYLQVSTVFDVHQENGVARFIEIGVENSILAAITYLDCILLSTIVFGFSTARHVPAFDKDYILILGCQIMKDGSLTKLLQGRADRALEFAEMQKAKTGKSIVFVPSGGQGSDEVMAEGEAIGNYLREKGVPEENILVENRSANTEENFRFSLQLIKRRMKDPKIAFSTTNFHVLRSGMLASQEGVAAEGIGSKTKSYFWINAFIREFVATIHAERKTHGKLLALIIAMVILMTVVLFAAVNV